MVVTINSLFEIYRHTDDTQVIKNIILPVKLIEAIDEDEIELITTSANSQNQIDTYQLLSNREFFKFLEDYFHKNIIDNKPIFYKRRIGQIDEKNYINVDLLIIMRALMSSIFHIPHRASGYFDSTMNKYLENLKGINQESYCKLIYHVTYLFVFVQDFLNTNKKDKIHLLKHHITFIIFKVVTLDTNFKKPRKMGDIPNLNENEIEMVCSKLNSLLSCREKFENLIKHILKHINDTDLNISNITKTNQKILYSPITKIIDNFDDFCIQLREYYDE